VGARNPNCLLGALLKEQFPGLVQLPGEGRVPEPGLTWPHYIAASAPPDERINGVECRTRADMVVATFWVTILISSQHLKSFFISIGIISLI
jgi:hypothetical protein